MFPSVSKIIFFPCILIVATSFYAFIDLQNIFAQELSDGTFQEKRIKALQITYKSDSVVTLTKNSNSPKVIFKIQNVGSSGTEADFFVNDDVFNLSWTKRVVEKTSQIPFSQLEGKLSVYKDGVLVDSSRPFQYNSIKKEITLLHLDMGEYIELVAEVGAPDLDNSNTLFQLVLREEGVETPLLNNIRYEIVRPELKIIYKIFSNPGCNGVIDSRSQEIDIHNNPIIKTEYNKCFVNEIIFTNETTHKNWPESIKIRQNLSIENSVQYIRNSLQYCIMTENDCSVQENFKPLTDAQEGSDGGSYSETSHRVEFVLKHIFKTVRDPNPDSKKNPKGYLATGNKGMLSPRAAAVFQYGFQVTNEPLLP